MLSSGICVKTSPEREGGERERKEKREKRESERREKEKIQREERKSERTISGMKADKRKRESGFLRV